MLVNACFICEFTASRTSVWSAIVHLTSEYLLSTSKIIAFLKKNFKVGGGSPHDLARPLHKEIIIIAVSLWGNVWDHPPPPAPPWSFDVEGPVERTSHNCLSYCFRSLSGRRFEIMWLYSRGLLIISCSSLMSNSASSHRCARTCGVTACVRAAVWEAGEDKGPVCGRVFCTSIMYYWPYIQNGSVNLRRSHTETFLAVLRCPERFTM